MLVALQNLEQVSLRLAPVVPVLAGLIFVGIGLCVWLGGLRWNRVVAGLIGAIAGALCGILFVRGHQVFSGSIATLVGSSLGSVFKRAVVVLVGGGNKGMIAAMYLTKYGGMSVGIFEERHELGTGWASEESPAPGFIAQHCSTFHATLCQKERFSILLFLPIKMGMAPYFYNQEKSLQIQESDFYVRSSVK